LLFAIIGIALEIIGFIFIIKSNPRLVLKQGGFIGDVYVDPKTDKPPPEIEGPPDPRMYRPGIYLVIAGLVAQGIDIAVSWYYPDYPL
jgi:hypothetical protein